MGRMIRFTGNSTRTLAPWIGRAAWLCLKLMVLSLISFWIGVPKTIDMMIEAWTGGELVHPTIERIYKFGAAISIVWGWIMLAHITVWLLKVIF